MCVCVCVYDICFARLVRSSMYIGVCWDRQHGKWKSQVNRRGKMFYLGRSESEEVGRGGGPRLEGGKGGKQTKQSKTHTHTQSHTILLRMHLRTCGSQVLAVKMDLLNISIFDDPVTLNCRPEIHAEALKMLKGKTAEEKELVGLFLSCCRNARNIYRYIAQKKGGLCVKHECVRSTGDSIDEC